MQNHFDSMEEGNGEKKEETNKISVVTEEFSISKRRKAPTNIDSFERIKRFKVDEEDEKLIIISEGLTELNCSPVLANTLLQILFENAPQEVFIKHKDVVIKIKCFMTSEIDTKDCIEITKYLKEKY